MAAGKGVNNPQRRVAEKRVAMVRRFNRFYTRQIGVLRRTFLDSSYSLAEARVLYEIASGGAPTASAIGRALDLDAGYLSRVLRAFEKRGLIERKISARDASRASASPSQNTMSSPRTNAPRATSFFLLNQYTRGRVGA